MSADDIQARDYAPPTTVEENVSALNNHSTPVEEVVGEPQKHTYASILQVAKGHPAPSALREQPVKKSAVPSDSNHVSKPPSRQSISGAEAANDTSVVEDEAEVLSVYVKNVPSTALASEIEQEFKKFGKIRPDGVAIRTRK
nr:hypothetical protein [Tanacetum cinerariifolium]